MKTKLRNHQWGIAMNTREKVIAALEKEKGAYVSGEALAKTCNVSRNAIWKSINELRKSGYPIESVNNRGYKLDKDSDIISKAGICMYLQMSEEHEDADRFDRGEPVFSDNATEKDPKNECTGVIDPDRIHVYRELDSTNNEAKRNILFENDRMLHGMVFVAMHQTAGRGHGGSSFSSPDGGIYFSMILEPDKMRENETPVTEMIADAVMIVLENSYHVITKKMKDSSLYVGEEKVCGILTEGFSDLETGVFSNYIVGIGVRVRRLQALGNTAPQKNKVIADIIRALI